MIDLTHADLVEIGAKWLWGKGCRVILKELSTAYKIPDVLGFGGMGSFLLEAKCSRSDFFADKKKIFRQSPHLGVGNFRSYICPKGLIKPEELPEN